MLWTCLFGMADSKDGGAPLQNHGRSFDIVANVAREKRKERPVDNLPPRDSTIVMYICNAYNGRLSYRYATQHKARRQPSECRREFYTYTLTKSHYDSQNEMQ